MNDLPLRFADRTRVLIFTGHPSVRETVYSILDFNSKQFDTLSEDGSVSDCESDFLILQTDDSGKVAAFRPNIVLTASDIQSSQLPDILENTVAGGIFIFHDALAQTVEESPNYFRRMEFSDPEYQTGNLDTELGPVPFEHSDPVLVKNINGIKLLAQQFGVMPEEFYDALMSVN